MEMYFTPATGEAVAEHASVLTALRRAGLEPLPELDRGFWVVGFAGSRTFVSFQEREGALSFATLELAMAEQDLGHAVFRVLQELGWRVEDDVG
jgi:hypothetical protein